MTQDYNKLGKTILVTRPIANSQQTKEYLLSKGYKVITQPLSGIRPCPLILPDNPAQFDALCASSAAAFLAIGQNDEANSNLNILKKLPLFCVGSKTAKAAQKSGFSHIAAIAQNADHLVSLLRSNQYQHFLYLAGKQRRPVLEDGLTAQGRLITAIETYETHAIIPTLDNIEKSVIFDAVLLYATIGLNGLTLLVQNFNADSKFLCLSSRIAQSLPQSYQQQAIIADEPTEESLLKLLLKTTRI